MSASSLLNTVTGQFLTQYLPTNPTPHPYVETITAGPGISVTGTSQLPVITNTGVPIVQYDATPLISQFKGDANQLGSLSVNRILRINYTTGPAPNVSWLFLPTPGVLNETYGLLWDNIGPPNTDVVEVNYGTFTPPAVPLQLFSVVPSTSGNEVYWITNIGPDNWVYWS